VFESDSCCFFFGLWCGGLVWSLVEAAAVLMSQSNRIVLSRVWSCVAVLMSQSKRRVLLFVVPSLDVLFFFLI